MDTSFTIALDGKDYKVEIHANTIVINGYPFVVGFDDDGKVIVDGIAYDINLDRESAIVDGIAHQFQVKGLKLESEPSLSTPERPAPSAIGAGAIQAIMPGTIVRVLAEVGQDVAAGDVLLVLEAMKMENEIQSPISGTVKAIHAQPGQAVEMNAVLAEIEPQT
jgi:biotin carboxyl carrier protein